MITFHSVFPELAQREVRCVHLGLAPDPASQPALPADEYAYLEFYLDLFRRFVLDEPYRLRLRRHYQLFRKELAWRQAAK